MIAHTFFILGNNNQKSIGGKNERLFKNIKRQSFGSARF